MQSKDRQGGVIASRAQCLLIEDRSPIHAASFPANREI